MDLASNTYRLTHEFLSLTNIHSDAHSVTMGMSAKGRQVFFFLYNVVHIEIPKVSLSSQTSFLRSSTSFTMVFCL